MNYYDVFGVSPTASSDDINSAHKTLAKKYHPDINSSNDAHEKMIMLNEAHEILSDNLKRKEYDKELNLNQPQKRNHEISASQSAVKPGSVTKITEERAGKAELLRRKAEAKLKTHDAAQTRRTEQVQKKDKEAFYKSKQMRVDLDKQHVVNILSDLVIGDNIRRSKNMDIDEERHYATKVLLSMVRNDNEDLRRRAEEAERKQRIDEILSLVKEINNEKE